MVWVVTGRDLVGVRDSGLVVSLEGVKLEAAVGITLLSSGGKEDRGECKKKGVGVGWGGGLRWGYSTGTRVLSGVILRGSHVVIGTWEIPKGSRSFLRERSQMFIFKTGIQIPVLCLL